MQARNTPPAQIADFCLPRRSKRKRDFPDLCPLTSLTSDT